MLRSHYPSWGKTEDEIIRSVLAYVHPSEYGASGFSGMEWTSWNS